MDNTLVDWFAANKDYCTAFALRHLPPMDDAARANAVQTLLHWGGDGNGITLPEFFALVAERWPIHATSDELARERGELFPTMTRPFPDTHATLSALKGRYRLGMVTNGDSAVQRKKIAVARLGPYFDTIVVSGDVPWPKPDPRIFHHALSQLGVRPEEAVFVGDSVEKDIMGAIAAGIHPVRLRLPGWNAPSVQGAREIDTLAELPRLLEEMEENSQ